MGLLLVWELSVLLCCFKELMISEISMKMISDSWNSSDREEKNECFFKMVGNAC